MNSQADHEMQIWQVGSEEARQDLQYMVKGYEKMFDYINEHYGLFKQMVEFGLHVKVEMPHTVSPAAATI